MSDPLTHLDTRNTVGTHDFDNRHSAACAICAQIARDLEIGQRLIHEKHELAARLTQTEERLSNNYRSPEDQADQRAKGWPDYHPEAFCHRCGFRNVQSWYTPHENWRDEFDQENNGIVCPQCLSETTKGSKLGYVTWAILTSEQHDELRERLREAGAALRLIGDGPHFEDCPGREDVTACDCHVADALAALTLTPKED